MLDRILYFDNQKLNIWELHSVCVCELEGGGGGHMRVCVRMCVCPEIGTLLYL